MILKRKFEDVFIFPFVLAGKLIATLQREKKTAYKKWLFFPFYHIGGAEKIHLQIAQAVADQETVIYFTKRSQHDRYLSDFKRTGAVVKDISAMTGNKWLYFFNLVYRGIIAYRINSQQTPPVVFNGQCNFAYKLSRWIRKDTRQIELIHSLNSFSYIRMPFIPFYEKTVMISRKRIEDHKELYKKLKVPEVYLERINFIPNAIHINDTVEWNKPVFKVIYSGRGGKEKRVHIVTSIAAEVNRVNNGIVFEFIGDVSDVIDQGRFPFVTFHGNIADEKRIDDIYRSASVLLLTSETEGFPLVIMEAMAHGLSVITTGVGDIPFHVTDNVNGYVFPDKEDETGMINFGKEKILALYNDQELLKKMSANNVRHARENFDIKSFNERYSQIIKPRIETA